LNSTKEVLEKADKRMQKVIILKRLKEIIFLLHIIMQINSAKKHLEKAEKSM
jgi:hypothetical protein